MEFLKAFPVAIIDEDYEGKQAAGRGMRQGPNRRVAHSTFAPARPGAPRSRVSG